MGRPVFVALGGLSATAGALAVVGACLPDLPPILPLEEAAAPVVRCGDGLIETLDDGGDAGESCDPGRDAQTPGCESCQVRCPGSIDDAGGHCYFLAEPATTYPAALSLCSAAKAHLATFASAREAAFASGLVDGGYWIGLSVDNKLENAYGSAAVEEPGWPQSGTRCSGCFALVNDAGEFPVHADVPDASEHQCLVAEDGGWFQVECNPADGGAHAYQTLCEREAVGERAYFCTGLFCTTLPATVGSKRYVIVVSPAPADEASAFCRSYDGGSLVTFATNEEREELVHDVIPLLSPPITMWIGLALDGGAWTWDDAVVADGTSRPLPWGNSQPAGSGERRAFLRIAPNEFDTQLAQSDDGHNEHARAFVCQRPLE